MGGRATAYRCRAQVHEPCASVDHPVELGHGAVEIEEREHRHAEDASVGFVAPVLFEPAVERSQAGVGQLDVIGHVLLDGHGHGRQHDRCLHALLVHQRQSGRPVGEGGIVLGVDDLAVVEAFGDIADEQTLQRPGSRGEVAGHDAQKVAVPRGGCGRGRRRPARPAPWRPCSDSRCDERSSRRARSSARRRRSVCSRPLAPSPGRPYESERSVTTVPCTVALSTGPDAVERAQRAD